MLHCSSDIQSLYVRMISACGLCDDTLRCVTGTVRRQGRMRKVDGLRLDLDGRRRKVESKQRRQLRSAEGRGERGAIAMSEMPPAGAGGYPASAAGGAGPPMTLTGARDEFASERAREDSIRLQRFASRKLDVARTTYEEQERLVWEQLSGLVRDAAWLKSYVAGAILVVKESLQGAAAGLGESKQPLPGFELLSGLAQGSIADNMHYIERMPTVSVVYSVPSIPMTSQYIVQRVKTVVLAAAVLNSRCFYYCRGAVPRRDASPGWSPPGEPSRCDDRYNTNSTANLRCFNNAAAPLPLQTTTAAHGSAGDGHAAVWHARHAGSHRAARTPLHGGAAVHGQRHHLRPGFQVSDRPASCAWHARGPNGWRRRWHDGLYCGRPRRQRRRADHSRLRCRTQIVVRRRYVLLTNCIWRRHFASDSIWRSQTKITVFLHLLNFWWKTCPAAAHPNLFQIINIFAMTADVATHQEGWSPPARGLWQLAAAAAASRRLLALAPQLLRAAATADYRRRHSICLQKSA